MKSLAILLLIAGAAQATITSSVIVEDAAQKDGRRYITERHTDHVGGTYEVRYIALAAADVNATMTARVATIEAELAENEIRKNLDNAVSDGSFVAPTTVHCTVAQIRARLRELYQTPSGWKAVCLGRYINSLGLTDQQLSSLFGVNGAQLTALKTKLANATTRFNQVTSEAGQ